MNNITVLGAGTMGNGIAHVFAQNNFKVNLVDISSEALENAIKTISKNLDRMVAKEKISEDDKNSTLNNLSTSNSIENGVKKILGSNENLVLFPNEYNALGGGNGGCEILIYSKN